MRYILFILLVIGMLYLAWADMPAVEFEDGTYINNNGTTGCYRGALCDD